jgi:hypothetical protein
MKRVAFVISAWLIPFAACAPAATPTHTPTLPSPTASLMPSATASPTATATSAPTLTSTPLPTATRTCTATPTAIPPPTQTPAATPTVSMRYPMVALREPQDGRAIEGIAVTFEWQPTPLQQDGDHYVVFVRRAQNSTWEKTYHAGGQLKLSLGIEDAPGYGDYVWNVFIVDAWGHVVSAEGGARKLKWCHKGSDCHECSSCHH